MYDSVRNGARFRFDFENRRFFIEGVKSDNDTLFKKLLCGLFDKEYWPMDKVIWNIEMLYRAYKHSVPSERSDRHGKKYFKAIRLEDMTDEDMLYGEPREPARFQLELYVYAFIVLGLFVWDEESMGKWFWQSEKDKDLVILRSWVEPKKEV